MQYANSIYAFLAWLANFLGLYRITFNNSVSSRPVPVAFLARRKGRPAGKNSAGAWPARY
jgi:hypothetical protein